MKQRALMMLLYRYVGFAFFMIFFDIFNVFRPVTGILAAISLLMACFYIGKYGNLPKRK